MTQFVLSKIILSKLQHILFSIIMCCYPKNPEIYTDFKAHENLTQSWQTHAWISMSSACCPFVLFEFSKFLPSSFKGQINSYLFLYKIISYILLKILMSYRIIPFPLAYFESHYFHINTGNSEMTEKCVIINAWLIHKELGIVSIQDLKRWPPAHLHMSCVTQKGPLCPSFFWYDTDYLNFFFFFEFFF